MIPENNAKTTKIYVLAPDIIGDLSHILLEKHNMVRDSFSVFRSKVLLSVTFFIFNSD